MLAFSEERLKTIEEISEIVNTRERKKRGEVIEEQSVYSNIKSLYRSELKTE